MPRFRYTVKDKGGKTLSGVIEADATSSAVQSLRTKDLLIISVKEEKAGLFTIGPGRKRKKRIKLDEIVVFSRQLATMVDAGIPLVKALDILAEQIDNPSFKEIAMKVRQDVETGSSLSDAFSQHPKVFSSLFVSMVRAGETSGTLDEILDRVASYLEKTNNLQKKVKSALVYPSVVTLMAIAITVLLMVKVIPVFKDIYKGFGAALPAPTQFLINVSDIMTRYFYAFIACAIVILYVFRRYIGTEKGRLWFDNLRLNIPVFGILIKKVAVGKFTRTLSTLIRSGVPILTSLEIVSKTAGNRVVEIAVDNVRSNVKGGETIAEPLARSKVFPPMVVRMVSVGEQSGELEKMLTKIADFYDEQVDTAVSGLTSLIEPIIIAFLGIIIGGIVICMFLPILQISTIVQF